MVLLVDVDLDTFKFMKRQDAGFLWIETTTAFVFLKPFPDLVARTVIMKTTPESDNAFKVRELGHTARQCINFTIDGVEMIKNAPVERETEGNIFEEKEKEEEVSEIDR